MTRSPWDGMALTEDEAGALGLSWPADDGLHWQSSDAGDPWLIQCRGHLVGREDEPCRHVRLPTEEDEGERAEFALDGDLIWYCWQHKDQAVT